jgi:hypothetical protein
MERGGKRGGETTAVSCGRVLEILFKVIKKEHARQRKKNSQR